MPAQVTDRGHRAPPRPLSKQEIDRRIQGALSGVFEEDAPAEGRILEPRWITPAEVVRRVLPLLSRN